MSPIGLLFVALLGLAGQGPTAPLDPNAIQQIALDYEVGAGDVLSIHVAGLQEFDQTTTVSNSGRIHVAHVGVMLVAGMTPLQIENEIGQLLKQRELLNEPSVRVQVEQYRAWPTYIVGEVVTPGQFVVSSDMYLLDLISRAGDVLPSAGGTALLYRRNPVRQLDVKVRVNPTNSPAIKPANPSIAPAGPAVPGLPMATEGDQVLQIDLEALRSGDKPEMNVKLQGGDVLYVPRRQNAQVFVVGDVANPGAYSLPRKGEITAAQAIIYAGGPSPTASNGKAFLMRHDAELGRTSTPIDFAAVIAGKETDITVRPDDIIFIPTSNVKTVTTGLLNMLPQLINQILIF